MRRPHKREGAWFLAGRRLEPDQVVQVRHPDFGEGWVEARVSGRRDAIFVARKRAASRGEPTDVSRRRAIWTLLAGEMRWPDQAEAERERKPAARTAPTKPKPAAKRKPAAKPKPATRKKTKKRTKRR